MASLIQEYRQRHGLNFVLPLDEGLCFFDCGKKPSAIVLTSSHSRNLTTCRQCLDNHGKLVAELYVQSGQLYPQQTYKMLRHEHIEPDLDLRQWVNDSITSKAKEGKYEPFVPSDDRELECWLWRFFVRNNPIYSRKWENKEEPFRSLEQIAWTINSLGTPRIFESFYKSMYYNFMLGRRYLIYG